MNRIKLSEIPTQPPKGMDKSDHEDKTKALIEELGELQNVLFAEGKHSLLVVLQGMDASGKDGVIKEVFSGVNPMGCRVKGFKKPSEEEMKHDFLWRVHKEVPEKGMIQIFNRSHYEDVVIQRVHEWVTLPVIKERYALINAFEKLLQQNGTIILKFYLHVSRDEQQERLKERLSDPRKMWKYNANDLEESKRWDEYMVAYEDAFNTCSPDIPWMVIPADKNWYKEYLIAKTIVEALKKLDMQYPRIDGQKG
ncbi:MAG TPA: polyphosphate kinase [Chitinophagales bacterium]|nr:polyphosphate kinase [Chitinophagales bacterium]HMZ88436.1 polyphosphate kinase [Chitinophagales bacterium]HNE44564.1 polyphosphate kinase [Chitinophagales bacterium]HNI53590.1 polyphosphate kinase [Chitinophagales bacterium]HNK98816.1 polyphosphate kinase [Chitinophagales bacterium]